MSAWAVEHPRTAVISIVLGCITLLLYAPARHFDYVSLDDPAYTDPPQVQQGLSWGGVRWAFTTGNPPYWHPLTWLSRMLDVELFGPGPAGAHFVNVVLHAANAVLVFIALRMATSRTWPSAIVAALFAIHPLRVESVAWVTERKDVLSALFFLLTLIAYTRYARSPRMVHYLLALFLFALGLMAKPMIVTLPFVLLLLDLWPLNRQQPWRRLAIEKLPFLLLAIAASAVTYKFQQQIGAMPEQISSLPLRLENVVLAYGRYLAKTIWPAKLTVFYPYMGALPGTSISLIAVIISAMVLLLITAGGLWMWGRNRAVLIGWLWFVGMLIPVSGLVQVGLQSMADRFTYLPHIGLFVAIVFGAGTLANPRAAVIVAAVLIALACRSSVQLNTWQDSVTLFTHALEVTTHNFVAHSHLAYSFMHQHRRPEAIDHLRAAMAINPRNPEAYYNMGVLFDESGEYQQAQSWYEQALLRDPNYGRAHFNLANRLLAQKQFDAAIEHYRKAIAFSPDAFSAHYNLALAISQRDGDAAALTELEQAVRLSPNHAEARYAYGLALRAAGREAQALEQFRLAAALASEQNLQGLLAEVQRQQKLPGALPKPATTTQNR